MSRANGRPSHESSSDEPSPQIPAQGCPVDITLDVIRGKWIPTLLWLLRDGGKRFSELEAGIPQLTHKVLSQQLRQLELNGVIHRRPQATSAIYEFTEFGLTLGPALDALAEWGKRYEHQLAGIRGGKGTGSDLS